MGSGGARWLGRLTLLALFLTVLGARLWLVNEYGNSLPYWDQWDGEAGETLKPWLDGKLAFADLFHPHAEHRIFLTRALALGLVALNGQWDARLEMTVDALLCAGIAVGLAAALRRALALRGQIVVPLAVAGLFCLPFAWENTLAGFQSQFYFLLGNSLLALWGLGTRRAFSAGWLAGLAGAILACVSMGSGVLAAAAVLGWSVVRSWRTRVWPGVGEMTTWLACFIVLVIGWQNRVIVPQHAGLGAGSGGAWLLALGRCLAWPRVTEPAWALVMVAPLAALAVLWFRRPRAADDARGENLLLLLGGWVALQAAAMAYARGGQNLPPQSRYMDVLALGAVLNALALVLLVGRQPRGGRRAAARGVAAVWTGGLLIGIGQLTARNVSHDLPEKRARMRTEAELTRIYVNTGDRRVLADKPPTDAFVPYPNIPYLLALLDDPGVRRILPAEVRAPLRVEVGFVSGGAFVEKGFSPATVDDQPYLRALGSYVPAAGGIPARGVLEGTLRPAPALPYLRFEVAGGLGGARQPGLALEVGGDGSGELRPARVPGDRWRTDFLAVPPGGPPRLVARDASDDGWVAFREPTEVGELSYWSGWLLRRGLPLFALGVAGLAAGLLARGVGVFLRSRVPAERRTSG